MISLIRIFKFALQGFFRNFWLSLVTITMMVMAVLSITILLAMDYVKEATVMGVENKIDILVELKMGISKEDVQNFIKTRKFLIAYSKIIPLLTENKHEEARGIMEEVFKVSFDENLGLDYF
jgi:cell division protein FtsX